MRIHSLRRVALLAAAAFSLISASRALAQDGTWTSLAPGGTPGLLRGHSNIFDRDHQRFVIFAGGSGSVPQPWDLMNDVWMLDVSGAPTWSLMPPGPVVPGGRLDAQYGYDAARNRLLIFGGYGRHYPTTPFEYLNDVWELSLNGTPHWTELFPAGQAPAGRLAGAAVYDPMRQRFIGFGGTQGVPVDTWSLNLQGNANWQNVPTTGDRPHGGYGMTSVYDASQDRMLIFGGSTSADYYGATNDVWELKLRGNPTWTLIEPTGERPPARRHGAAIFDPLRNRMVIFGGANAVPPPGELFFADAWALDFDSDPPVWTELHPDGTLPTVRDNMPAAYDPLNDRLIVFGGFSGTAFLSDTQFLTWGGTSSEASLTGSGSATPTSAHLEWEVDAATGAHAAVYRKPSGGEWTAIAEAEVDGTGTVIFDDATVTAGQDYDYMMVVGSQRGETFGGTTSIEVPTTLDAGTSAADFALHRVVPNPVAHDMAVSLSLPTSDPATLELIDATGRRWLQREVGLGAGRHRVELAPGQVPAGLYFLRLQHRGRVAMARVVMLGVR